MNFQLTNKEREYLGLEKIAPDWDKFVVTEELTIYFSGNTIRKAIYISEKSYETIYKEEQLNEETNNRETLLPKTKRGKPKNLTASNIKARNPTNTYFMYSAENGVIIGNHTSQKTFYETNFEKIEIPDFTRLKEWLKIFIAETTPNQLKEIKKFGQEKRKKSKINAGDFFRFKIGRKQYGYGRVLLDIRKLRKDGIVKNSTHYGLRLAGQPLVIKIYHIISENNQIDLEELKLLHSFPSQYIMDNRILYTDYEVIGNLSLEPNELEFPISYSTRKNDGISSAYLQYGLLFLETDNPTFDITFGITSEEYHKLSDEETKMNRYRNESNGFSLNHLSKPVMEQCILENDNSYFWKAPFYKPGFFEIGAPYNDLRNPINKKDRNKIFSHFKLDIDKDYSTNFNKINVP